MEEPRFRQEELDGLDASTQSDQLVPVYSERKGPTKYFYGTKKARSRRPESRVEQRAVGMGWLSIGLGFAQLMVPRLMARAIGAGESTRARAVMLACGVRELASGVGILAQPRPSGLLWARVAGDLLDLALLARAAASHRAARSKVARAGAVVLGVTLFDLKTALDLSRERRGHDVDRDGLHVKRSITVNATPDVVYRYWRDFENLPKFMQHLEEVKVHEGHSYWRAKGPLAMDVEWEAEIVVDRPGEVIRWQSAPDANVPNRGEVRFTPAPGGRGTEVSVDLSYEPPGGSAAQLVAKLFGEEPAQQIHGDLRRFKQLVETGEVLHSDASIHKGPHPARPSPGQAPQAPQPDRRLA